jgi:hypothetical protein
VVHESKTERSDRQHALDNQEAVNAIIIRSEGQVFFIDQIPLTAKRKLDIGTGDGRLIKLIKV